MKKIIERLTTLMIFLILSAIGLGSLVLLLVEFAIIITDCVKMI